MSMSAAELITELPFQAERYNLGKEFWDLLT